MAACSCSITATETVTKAHRGIVAIGRSGNYRKLGVPGEELDKVFNRLHDPKDFGASRSWWSAAATRRSRPPSPSPRPARVTLSYRKKEFSRPKPENVEKIRRLEKNPAAAVAVERPTSERVTTSTGTS